MLEKLFWNQDARKRLARLAPKKPWDHPCPRTEQAAYRLLGMLGSRKSLLFYHLARNFYAGRGAVVDAGSFLGKSASLFAAGTAQNPVAPLASRKVYQLTAEETAKTSLHREAESPHSNANYLRLANRKCLFRAYW